MSLPIVTNAKSARKYREEIFEWESTHLINLDEIYYFALCDAFEYFTHSSDFG